MKADHGIGGNSANEPRQWQEARLSENERRPTGCAQGALRGYAEGYPLQPGDQGTVRETFEVEQGEEGCHHSLYEEDADDLERDETRLAAVQIPIDGLIVNFSPIKQQLPCLSRQPVLNLLKGCCTLCWVHSQKTR